MFCFLELPVFKNVRYLSVGISDNAVLNIIKTLLGDCETVCAYPILTSDEIEACRKTSFKAAKDARNSFNTMFGISSKYIDRNINKSPEMQTKGNLQDALGAAHLRYLTYAESSSSEHHLQPISISSSEDLCNQDCIFKISSDLVKETEKVLRECEIVHHDDVKIITAAKSALISSKTSAFRNMIVNPVPVNSMVNESEIKSIVCIMKFLPIEFSHAPNGSLIRASRPLACQDVRLTTTGVFRLVILIFFIVYLQYCIVARLTFVRCILEPMEIGITFIEALNLWRDQVTCWMLKYPVKRSANLAVLGQRLSDGTTEDLANLAERDTSEATHEVLCAYIPDVPYTDMSLSMSLSLSLHLRYPHYPISGTVTMPYQVHGTISSSDVHMGNDYDDQLRNNFDDTPNDNVDYGSTELNDFHLDPSDINPTVCKQIINYCAKLNLKVNFDFHVISDSGVTSVTFIMPDQNKQGFFRKCGIVKIKFVLEYIDESRLSLTFENCSCQHYEDTSRLYSFENRPSCFHLLIIAKNIAHVVISSHRYTIDYSPSARLLHGAIVKSLLDYLLIPNWDQTNNSCIGPLSFSQVVKTLKWSFEDGINSFVVTATLNSNVESIYWKCNSNLCRNFILKRGATVMQEMKVASGKKTNKGLCNHLKLFIDAVGMDQIDLAASDLFHRAAAIKKTAPNSHFNVETGRFEFKSLCLDIFTKQQKPGFLFPVAMGFQPYCDIVVQTTNTLELKMILAPYDTFGTGLKDCTVSDVNCNFKLQPEILLSATDNLTCFCAQKNQWEEHCQSTGTVVTVYGHNRAALCELMERRTKLCSQSERNCSCVLQYNGVVDGIFLLNQRTAVLSSVLDKFLRSSDWNFNEFCQSMDLDYESRMLSGSYIKGRKKLFMSRHTLTKFVFGYIMTLGIETAPVSSLLLADGSSETALQKSGTPS